MECGGKRSATPLWVRRESMRNCSLIRAIEKLFRSRFLSSPKVLLPKSHDFRS